MQLSNIILAGLSRGGHASSRSNDLEYQISTRSVARNILETSIETDILLSESQNIPRRRGTQPETFEISEGLPGSSHPSQVTTTDESVLSTRDPNSQSFPPYQHQGVIQTLTGEEIEKQGQISAYLNLDYKSSTSLDSCEPSQPPPLSFDNMSNIFPENMFGEVGSGHLSTREKLQLMRQQNTQKPEQGRSPNLLASPPLIMERPLPRVSNVQNLSPSIQAYEQQPKSHVAPLLPLQIPNANQQSAVSADPPLSTSSHDSANFHIEQLGPEMLRAGTGTPDIIPDKPVYQIQVEPERLEVQPLLQSTEVPLSLRSSNSVPHTPATPSKIVLHREASPSQTLRLEPKNLGKCEYIVPLCMQKRILRQYMDTIEYYPDSIKQNMSEENLEQKHVEKLNELLGRLANVANHIGLEGGGPGSQDSVHSEQEALYAEMSSEKFKFLGHLIEIARDQDLHIALIARSGALHDIIETYLRGKKVIYNRPGTFSRPDAKAAHSKLRFSVIASGKDGESGVTVARKADLVIALDETFNAKDSQIVDLRTSNTSVDKLSPVVRLVVHSSVEHLDLCLPRRIDPVDRLRRLIFCVWHTQNSIGDLESHELDTAACAEAVAHFLRSECRADAWKIPFLRSVVIPNMDSDSSLSDAMSDVSAEVGRPHEQAHKFWPNTTSSLGASNAKKPILSNGKRPFVSTKLASSGQMKHSKLYEDLEYGDSLEVQVKKQKMAQRSHAGRPLDEVCHRSVHLSNLLNAASPKLLKTCSAAFMRPKRASAVYC